MKNLLMKEKILEFQDYFKNNGLLFQNINHDLLHGKILIFQKNIIQL